MAYQTFAVTTLINHVQLLIHVIKDKLSLSVYIAYVSRELQSDLLFKLKHDFNNCNIMLPQQVSPIITPIFVWYQSYIRILWAHQMVSNAETVQYS